MDAWLWWAIAVVVLVVAEVLTTSLVFAMVAGGAAAATVVALLGAGAGWQLAVFAAVSLGLLVVVRPVAVRHLHMPTRMRTGVDALVGQEATVLERVDGADGRVKLSGEIWSARSYDGESTYDVDEVVRVVKISGATALVG